MSKLGLYFWCTKFYILGIKHGGLGMKKTVKYKNSPYYKGSELWDSLALATINCDNLFEFKQCLRKRFINYLQD